MNIVKKQFLELRKEHPYLYIKKKNDWFFLRGTIFFECEDIKDHYDIEISVSKEYPKEIPLVKEIGGRIPKDYHYNGENLCIETPFRVWEIFRKEESLLNFVDNLVIPYLFSYSAFKKSGHTNLGEHEHGARGVLDDYKKRFGVNDDFLSFLLLRILAEKNYRGHSLCPCGSGEKLKKCHGKPIYEIVMDRRFMDYDFMKDFIMVMIQLKEENIISDIRPYTSDKLIRCLKQMKNRPDEKWNY